MILVPGADFELGGAERTDTRVVKTLLTIDSLLDEVPPEERPQVVAEVFEPDMVPLARGSLGGRIEVVASDRVLSRLISQSLRHRGLAPALLGLLSHREGNSLYLRGFPELAGTSPHALHGRFPRAVVLGFLRDGRTHLDPARPEVLERNDLLLFLAEGYDRCAPGPGPAEAPPAPRPPSSPPPAGKAQRILVLGWSHKMAYLVEELDADGTRRFEMTVMSRVDVEERARWLGGAAPAPQRVTLKHVAGNYALEAGDVIEVVTLVGGG